MENNTNKEHIAEEEHPVKLEIKYPERSSRFLALLGIPWFFLKTILLIPHIIILWFLGFVYMLITWIALWVVLFSGKYPKLLFDFAVGVMRWQVRVNAWLLCLTDKYPPFSFQ